MTKADVLSLFAYNKWANDRTLASLDQLSEEQFTRPLGSSFPTIAATAAHIAGAEWVWLSRWKGANPTGMPDWAAAPSLAAVKLKFAELESERAAYLSTVAEADLLRPTTFKLFNGTDDAMPLAQQFQHLVNHGTYHRGQVAGMLRQTGATPTPTDFLRWVRETRT